MSERSTAEIVANLRNFVLCLSPNRPTDHIGEAADRLAELDADLEATRADALIALDQLAELDALRPTCPTCGGKGRLSHCWECEAREEYDDPCPDCVDGKVSIEQLAATWRRVWMFPVDDRTESSWTYDEGWRACIDHLRSVRS